MSGNRIRRYDALWKASTSPAAEPGPTPRPSVSPTPTDIPPGFVVFPLAHLTPAERQAIAARAALYERAYNQARREADERFVRDWVI